MLARLQSLSFVATMYIRFLLLWFWLGLAHALPSPHLQATGQHVHAEARLEDGRLRLHVRNPAGAPVAMELTLRQGPRAWSVTTDQQGMANLPDITSADGLSLTIQTEQGQENLSLRPPQPESAWRPLLLTLVLVLSAILSPIMALRAWPGRKPNQPTK